MAQLSVLQVVNLFVLLWLSIALPATAQQSIAFTFPPPATANTKTIFNIAENVKITWTTTWPTVSLELWQGPGDGGKVAHIALLTNVTSATTTYLWSAHNLKGIARKTPFHLYLYNSNNPTCDNCHANSSTFTLQERDTNSPTSTTASLTSTSTSTSSTTPSTTSPTPTESSSGNSGGSNNSSLKLGLGVGLGVGIPLIIALTGFAVWFCMRKRRSNKDTPEEQMTDWKQPPPADSTGGYMSPLPPSEVDGGHSMGELSSKPTMDHERVELEGSGVSEMRGDHTPLSPRTGI